MAQAKSVKSVNLADFVKRPQGKEAEHLKKEFIKVLNPALHRALCYNSHKTYGEYDSDKHSYRVQLTINNKNVINQLKGICLKLNMPKSAYLDYQAAFLTTCFQQNELFIHWTDKPINKHWAINPKSIRINFTDPRQFNPKVQTGLSFSVDFNLVRIDKK